MRRLFFFSAESEGFSFQEFPWLQHAGSVVPAPGLQSTGSVESKAAAAHERKDAAE